MIIAADLVWIPVGLLIAFAAASALASIAIRYWRFTADRFSRIGAGFQRLPCFLRIVVCACGVHGLVLAVEKTNAPPTRLSAPHRAPTSLSVTNTISETDIARGWQIVSVSTNANISYALPSNGVRRTNWRIRGAFEDVARIDLGGFFFPYRDEQITNLWVHTWGFAFPRLGTLNTPLVAVGTPMSAVPHFSDFWSASTTNDSFLLTWHDFALNRDTNALLSAQIELLPAGDFILRSNRVERVCRRVDSFDWDGDGLVNDEDPHPFSTDGDFVGQSVDWIQLHYPESQVTNTTDYSIWVDACVGNGRANGLYRLTVSIPPTVARRTRIRVGTRSLVIDHPGDYPFLLEKGVDYTLELEPFDSSIQFTATDDIQAESTSRSAVSWPDVGRWTLDGGNLDLRPPAQEKSGNCIWHPWFFGSPDITYIGPSHSTPIFEAHLYDVPDCLDASYEWSCSNSAITIVSPTSRLTDILIPTLPSWDRASLEVAVTLGTNIYRSALVDFTFGLNSTPQIRLSLNMPSTFFVNNDDDNGDGEADFDQVFDDDDELICVQIEFHSDVPTNGVLKLVRQSEFYGKIYKKENNRLVEIFTGSEICRIENASLKSSVLWLDANTDSYAYQDAQIGVSFEPDEGESLMVTHNFTVLEPIMEPITTRMSHGKIVNPSFAITNEEVRLAIVIDTACLPDSEIRWRIVSGTGMFTDNINTGRDVGFIAGGDEGREIEIEVQIGDFNGNLPRIKMTTCGLREVLIYPCEIIRVGRPPQISTSHIQMLLDDVNTLFRQVGLCFSLGADIRYVENDEWAMYAMQRRDYRDGIRGVMSNTGGLEVYFVAGDSSNIQFREARGLYTPSGIIVKKDVSGYELGHEIGHACGWADIYSLNEEVLLLGVKEEWMPEDWSHGTGCRYYSSVVSQQEAISRLLMNGIKGEGRGDIPHGNVYGIPNKTNRDNFRLIQVGGAPVLPRSN